MSYSAPPPAASDVPDVRGIVVEEREPALDGFSGADAPGRHELADGDPRRMEAIHERFHEAGHRRARRPRSCARRRGRSVPAAFRTGRACRPRQRRSPTPRAGGSGAGCTRRRRPGRRGAPRSEPWAAGMRELRSHALGEGEVSRGNGDDLTVLARAMPGMTLVRAMVAVDRIPQRGRRVRRHRQQSLHGHDWAASSELCRSVQFELARLGRCIDTDRRDGLSLRHVRHCGLRTMHASRPSRP